MQFEKRNASTRNLNVLQASLMCLELGQWSGFKRKMEIAESFLQPHLTVCHLARRSCAWGANKGSDASARWKVLGTG